MGHQFEIQNSHRTGKLLSCPPLEIGPRSLLMPGEIENIKVVTGSRLLSAYSSVLMLSTKQYVKNLISQKIKSPVCHLEFVFNLPF